MSRENNVQDEERSSSAGGENDEGVSITSAVTISDNPTVLGTGTPMREGESLASSGDSPTTGYDEIDDSRYGAIGGEGFISVSGPEDSGFLYRRTLVCQETNNETDVCIRKHVKRGFKPVSPTDRSQRNHISRDQTRFDRHQDFLTFTYAAQGINKDGNYIDMYDTVGQASMIVPSGAYYSSSHIPPMAFPTYGHNPVNMYSGQDQLLADDTSPLSQSDEFRSQRSKPSDQGLDESSVYEENNDETE